MFCWKAEVKLPVPTARQIERFDDVPSDQYSDNIDDDSRHPSASATGRLRSVDPPTRTLIPTGSVVGRRDQDGLVNPLYVGIPTACACVLLSVLVLGLLLLWYGRGRRTDDRRKSAADLLPSYRTDRTSLDPRYLPAVEFSRSSHQHCICLHCSRPPDFVAKSAAYSPVETRS